MKLKIHYDRMLKSILPPSLLVEMETRELIVSNDKYTISFVGAIIHDNCINVFLPRSSGEISDNHQYKYAALTMSAVEKFGRKSKTQLHNTDKGGTIDGELNLTLVKSILTDFQQNGIYTRRHKEIHINSGKPDWKRTVNRFLPFMNKRGAPVYLDYFSKKNRYNSDNIVSQIHSDIVAYLDVNFAWWITGNHKHRIAPELYGPNNIHENAHMKLSILQQELSTVYSDSDIRLIHNLIEFIKQTEGTGTSPIITGLKDFHNAWEAMLRSTSAGVVDLNNQLPKPSYVDTNGITSTASGMLTDIIIENDDKTKLAIVDAKYYAAKTINNSPNWPDIVKQFYYEKAVKLVKRDYEVSNHFIFPGNDGPFTEIKMQDQVGDNNLDDVFSPIQCMYVCPLKVMKHYVDGTAMLSHFDFE